MRIGINAHLLAFSGTYRQAGLSRYIYELLTRAPRIDRRSRYTAFVDSDPLPPAFTACLPPNLRVSRSRLPTSSAPLRILWEQTALPLAAARRHLNLLHSPVNVVPLTSRCPSVVTVHDLIFLRYPQNFRPAKRFYLRYATMLSCRAASHVIAVSEATRRDVIELLGINPGRVTTVHNGVGEEFRPLPADEVERFRLSKRIDGRVLLYVGTLEPRKNLPTLLHAFREMIAGRSFNDVTLVIGGSKGWYYDSIFATAEQLGLLDSGRVRFVGRVPDDELPLWYNCAALFVYPSVYEGFGLPALEAMACGTPVITSSTSAFPEVVGDAGLLVEPESPAAWTAAMARLLGDEKESRELAERGLSRSQRFSWERAAAETVKVYHRVLSGRP